MPASLRKLNAPIATKSDTAKIAWTSGCSPTVFLAL